MAAKQDGSEKRVRSENFNFNDKKLLLEILESRKYIVENKRCDVKTSKAKEIAWVLITNRYNTVASIPRKPENLKTCWDNMKKKYKFSILNPSPDVGKHLNASDIFLNKKIADILASTRESACQDICQNSNDSNAFNSEPIDVDNRDLNDNQSCTSQDSLNFETNLKEYSEKWTRLKEIKGNEKVENMEGVESTEKAPSKKSRKDAPYVLMLTSQDLNSDSEALNENITKTLEFAPQMLKNSINLDTNDQLKIDKNTSKKQNREMKHMNYALAEAKLELAKLTKEHAVAEEKRKAELHQLQIEEAKLKIELLKLELIKKGNPLVFINED